MFLFLKTMMTLFASLSLLFPFFYKSSSKREEKSFNSSQKRYSEVKDFDRVNLKKTYSYIASALAVLSVPFLSWGLYEMTGSPPDFKKSQLGDRFSDNLKENSFLELLARVEDQLIKNPKDGKGWDLVAPIYLKMKRFPEALQAYKNSIQLNGSNAMRESGRGEVLVLKENGFVLKEAEQAFRKALSIDPHFSKALFFLGLLNAQKGNKVESQSMWKKILEKAKKEDHWRVAAEIMLKKIITN